MSTTSNPRGRPFPAGTSGNPAGRRTGARHKTTVLCEKLLAADAASIISMVLNLAKLGDLGACRIVVDRLIPPMKERPVVLALPDTSSAEGIAQAQGAVIAAVAEGDLLLSEGASLAGLLEARRKALETADLERRINAIEARLTQ